MRIRALRPRPRAGSLLTGLLLLGLLGPGCRRPLPTGGLPDGLAAVVALSDGQMISVLIELPRPGVEPSVRLSEGAIAFDTGWASAWMVQQGARGQHESVLMDLSDATRVHRHLLPGPVQLRRLDADGAVVSASNQLLRLSMGSTEGATRLSLDPGPAGETLHPGPAGGFALRVQEGRLELRLPRSDGVRWRPVMHDVDYLVGSWWVLSTTLPPWQRRVVDDRFKQVGVITTADDIAVPDGDLSEWRGQTALGVDHPSQLLTGQGGWRGERDAAFGVAARRGQTGSVVAVRVRDDIVDAPSDLLVFRTDEQEIIVPLDGHASTTSGPGWTAVRSERDGWDQYVELHLDEIRPENMVVHFLDSDPGEELTVLATAPYPAMLALGALVLEPEGPARPEPQ